MQVIAGNAVVTSDSQRRVLEPGWVAIEDGVITAVEHGEPASGAPTSWADLVLPGLVSAHQHLVDVLVRGGPTGPTFLDWLLATYHAGLAHARPDDCGPAIGAVRATGLAAGVTTVVDCWSVGPVDDAIRVAECADASIDAHRASGGRTVFAPMFCEVVPDGWDARYGIDPARLCRAAEESLAWIEALARRWSTPDRRLTVTPSPELPETSTSAGLQGAHALASRLGSVMPIHLCASPPSRAAFGPDVAAALGLLGPGLLAAHCSAVDDDDIAVLGGSGIGVAHCPSAALAMGASVFTPLARLRSAGATGSLGLDNASLYAGSDMFEEARRAQHTSHLMGADLDAATLLDLLTVEGARAAGLGDHVGSLEVGKRADLVVLDTSGSHWGDGRGSWPDRILEAARADDVQAVYVDGHAVARHGVALHQPDPSVVAEVLARIPALMGWSPPSRGR